MKKKSKELNVDYIGGQDKLTKAEETALAEYFAQRRKTKTKLLTRSSPRTKKKVKA